MAGFIAPIVQGLSVLREFQDKQKQEEARLLQEEQVKQTLEQILISRFMEREEQ
jgi:hypothetical protein